MSGAQITALPGGRLHLHHGPIDMIVGVTGPGRAEGLRRAAARFDTLLTELAAELPRLRAPAGPTPNGRVARAMVKATAPFNEFITPMAAVAGAGADAVLAALVGAGGIDTAYVNNGGDGALHVGPGQSLTAAIAMQPPARARIGFDDPARGVATSGWRGRSQSLGIAESVTVLARNAAMADAAATLIANAVDLPGHPAIRRRPAREVFEDSDLGARLVTVDVGPLTPVEVAAALARGLRQAEAFRARGLICAAALSLGGETRLLDLPRLIPEPEPAQA
ncbi:UPF0280 family protein [Roseovarius spongiae]|uniref:UPF0280 family protein n=1 Tax=Roseovarius spongiae TaxID=2320272 RepID=A0A3A8ARH2_9RHOB|nr:UPF0280 family protein [Roseovarius spongiae]RKF13490.1 UPF0280 family protein [Roseovarius spongiae]